MENIVILFKAIITKVNGEEMFHLEKGRKSFPTAHIMKDSFLMASKTESGAIYQIQVFTKANLRMATSMGKVPLLMSTTVLSREIGWTGSLKEKGYLPGQTEIGMRGSM